MPSDMHSLPERVVFFGAMRPDAVLTAAPSARAKMGRWAIEVCFRDHERGLVGYHPRRSYG